MRSVREEIPLTIADVAGNKSAKSISRVGVIPLLIASRNAHKTREFAELLGDKFEITDLTRFPEVPSVEENGSTFKENAVLKAVSASRALPGLVAADDSGLEVAALGGAPGVYSARYAGKLASDRDNIVKLLKELAVEELKASNRVARFSCAIALARNGVVLQTFHGSVIGSILAEPSGNHGFGYDPIFVPTGLNDTFANLGAEVKNRISHRANAARKLRQYLESAPSADSDGNREV